MEQIVINSLCRVFEEVLEAYDVTGAIPDRLVFHAQHEIMMARAPA